VQAGDPAEQGGIKPGDLILMVGSANTQDLRGLMTALRAHKPGDEVDVVVRRGEETLTLKIRLGGQ
jgi:S1-C subfamily serine protease